MICIQFSACRNEAKVSFTTKIAECSCTFQIYNIYVTCVSIDLLFTDWTVINLIDEKNFSTKKLIKGYW